MQKGQLLTEIEQFYQFKPDSEELEYDLDWIQIEDETYQKFENEISDFEFEQKALIYANSDSDLIYQNFMEELIVLNCKIRDFKKINSDLLTQIDENQN